MIPLPIRVVGSSCLFIAVLLFHAWRPTLAEGMGKYLYYNDIDCEVKEISGTFRSSVGSYKTSGTCKVRLDPKQFPNEANSWRDFSFTGGGSFDPSRTIAQEKINLFDLVTRQKKGSIVSEWTCNRDPWLSKPIPKTCAKIEFKARFETSGPESATHLDQLVAQYQEFFGSFPLSSNLRSTVQAAIDKQYQIAMATQQRLDQSNTSRLQPTQPAQPGTGTFTPGGSSTTSTAVLAAQMPRILLPARNATVVQGQMVLKIQAPATGTMRLTDMEFTWLDAPKAQPYVNTFSAETPNLLQGYPVDQRVTRGQWGRWQVRIRMSGQSTPGPWSVPVAFTLVATQPTQSQTLKPAQSSTLQTLDQARRSGTTLILPRGIEENPTAGSGTDQGEKKP